VGWSKQVAKQNLWLNYEYALLGLGGLGASCGANIRTLGTYLMM